MSEEQEKEELHYCPTEAEVMWQRLIRPAPPPGILDPWLEPYDPHSRQEIFYFPVTRIR